MQVRRERKQPVLDPLISLAPCFLRWILVALYLYLQPTILHHHLIPFVFYVGLINAYSVGQMIVAHLTKDPTFPMSNVLTIPLGLAVIDSIGLWPSVLGDGTYQIAFVFCCLGLSIGVYGSFVVGPLSSSRCLCLLTRTQYDIITTICDYLDIWCLTIKHPYREGDEAKKAN